MYDTVAKETTFFMQSKAERKVDNSPSLFEAIIE